MPVEPSRATFVQREYRSEVSEDLSIRSSYSTATELVLNTNLTADKAAALAVMLHDECREPAEAYRITVEGQGSIDSIALAPICWEVILPTYGAQGVFKTASFEIDPFENRTTYLVKK